jgi:hypothetical protein
MLFVHPRRIGVAPIKHAHAPAVDAETAFRLFCEPARERPEDYARLAKRARFHLRHASVGEFGGVRTYVLEPAGAAKGTALLIHGWASEASFMAAFAEALRRMGYRAVLFDMPAHGRSAGERADLGACARAAHRVASAFGPLRGIVGHSLGGLLALWIADGIVGHSLGGLLALWIAEGGPPLGAAIPAPRIALLASPNRFIDVARDFGAHRGLSGLAQLGFERRLSRAAGRIVERFSAAALIPALESDVLAVHSLDDEKIPFADAEAIAGSSSRVRLLRMGGLGHSKLLYDGGVIRSVASFLDAGADSGWEPR